MKRDAIDGGWVRTLAERESLTAGGGGGSVANVHGWDISAANHLPDNMYV